MILGICDNADILSVMRIVNVVIMIIQIAVPIILIIMCMIEFMGAIKIGDQDLLKKASQSAARKAIACVIIFMVPTLVTTLVKISAPDSNFTACIDNATLDNINNTYASSASELMEVAESTESYTAYYQAREAVNKITDESLRSDYESRLDALYLTLKTKMEEANEEDALTKPGSGYGGTGENNSAGSGTYKVEYRDGVFYVPNARATSDSHTVRQSGISGTNPEFGRRLEALINDAAKLGHTVTITEGFRPYSTQAKYWNESTRPCSERTKWVACPGGSRHGWGIAADLAYNGTGCSGGWDCNSAAKWVHDNAKNYGLTFRLSNEPWHIEPENVSGGNYGACAAPC